MKKLILIFLTLVPSISFAQEATKEVSFMSDPTHHPMFPLFAIMAFVFVVLVMIGTVTINIIKVLNLFSQKMAEEKAKKEGRAYIPEPSWSEKFWQQFNNSVPLAEEKTIELDHNYDGIRELDNHLPPWWKWLFYGTIVWSVVYLVVYHVTESLPLSEQEYENQITQAEEAKQKFLASQPVAVIDENALEYTADAALISNGKKVFITNNCQSCHRVDGGGNAIGPNLTDPYWIHGGAIKNIFTTVKNGVVEKGMPAWGKVMSPSDVRDVVFYVMSLQGSNPANPKAPQGELEKPAEPKTTIDSAKVVAAVN
jgi:cytochrome c oxidase cbb3-type subunit 3